MSFLEKQSLHFLRRPLPVIFFVVIAVLGFFSLGFVSYAEEYKNKVLPGVHIGDIPIGGMTKEDLASFLEEMNNRMIEQGILVTAKINGTTNTFQLYPTVVPEENLFPIVDIDVEKESERLLGYRQSQEPIIRGFSALATSLLTPSLRLEHIEIDDSALQEQLSSHLIRYQVPVRNATVRIEDVLPSGELVTSIVPSTIGHAFSINQAREEILEQWSRLSFPSLFLETKEVHPTVTERDVESILPRLSAVFSFSGLTLTYADPHAKRDRSWKITKEMIEDWIEVHKIEDGLVGFGLRRDAVRLYLEKTVAKEIETEPRDAKFEIGLDNKVKEFQSSRPGVSLFFDKTYEAVNSAFLARSWQSEGVVSSVPLQVEMVEPKIKTGEVNNLGIQEVLGVGHSNFSGSPPNRVKNIRHAVMNKLNGLLIKPVETFSALEALRPFTIEGGYLPELVIKGDQIIPEIGGGLCQIGSTLFRMAMQSGMSIVERRNHSIVVRYYNDLRNGNPGTDATIYDPDPDFRFTNDTGHYVLLTTEMNQKTGDLWFTLWGTSDGRTAFYTEPIVDKWIPAGETKMIETDTLAPGDEKCQEKHNGASAHFTYVRTLPGKEKEEIEYKSYYRSLPKICLVGVDSAKKAAEDGVWTPADDIAALEGVEMTAE